MDDSDVKTVYESIQKAYNAQDIRQICVHISSGGGASYSCYGIADMLRMSPKHVITVNHSYAFSAASIVFISGKERWMSPHAALMFHESQIELGGTSLQLDLQAKEVLRMNKIDIELLKEIGVSKDMIERIDKAGVNNVFVDAEEALRSGLATHIGMPACWLAPAKKIKKNIKRKRYESSDSD